MKIKILLLCLISVLLFNCSGCNKTAGPDDTLEPIDIQSSFNYSSNFEESIKKHILADESFNSANILLLSLIKSDSVTNPFTPSPITNTKVAAYFEYPSKFQTVLFNNIGLVLTVSFLSNIHFTIPSSWNSAGFNYGGEYEWQFVSIAKESAIIEESLCNSIHPARILGYKDTLMLGNEFSLIWANPLKNGKIFIDFSFDDKLTRKELTGVQAEDDGNYIFDKDYLESLGINRNGTLIINILRIYPNFHNISFTDTGILKAVSYTMTQAKITIYIKAK